MAAGMSLAEVRGLTLGQVQELMPAVRRRERNQALLALYAARAAQLDGDGYRNAWEQISGTRQ